MPEIIIREATREDVYHIATHMRKADVVELLLAQNKEPAQAVRESYGKSIWSKCALVDGRPTVLYGVAATDMEGCGSPWMLATNDLYKIKEEFVVGSKSEVAEMRKNFRLLSNQVHKDNSASINWLEWLGFHVDRTPAGPLGEFFNFWMGEVSNG